MTSGLRRDGPSAATNFLGGSGPASYSVDGAHQARIDLAARGIGIEFGEAKKLSVMCSMQFLPVEEFDI